MPEPESKVKNYIHCEINDLRINPETQAESITYNTSQIKGLRLVYPLPDLSSIFTYSAGFLNHLK